MNRLFQIQENLKTLRVKIHEETVKAVAQSLPYNVASKAFEYYSVPDTKEIAIGERVKEVKWAAMTAMLHNWKNKEQKSIGAVLESIGQQYLDEYRKNNVMLSPQISRLLTDAGLVHELIHQPSAEKWVRLLQTYGPIWVAPERELYGFATSARLLIGIHGDGTPKRTFLVFIDPDDGEEHPEAIHSFISKYQWPGKSVRMQLIHWPVLKKEELSDAQGKFVPRGNKSSDAQMTWVNQTIASGENPKKRVYFVTSGAYGQWKMPAKILVNIKNRNDSYNLKDTHLALSLATDSLNAPFQVVPFDKQGQGEKYLFLSSAEIPDESSRTIPVELGVNTLHKAYNLLDLNDPHMKLDVQFYWREGAAGAWITRDWASDYLYNQLFCDFYLVNPVEFIFNHGAWMTRPIKQLAKVGTREIIKDGKVVQLKYPDYLDGMREPVFSISPGINYSLKISLTESESNAYTDQISTSVKITDTTSTTVGVQAKTTQKATFGIGNDLVKAGLESGNELSASYQRTTSRSVEIAKSYLHSQTVQRAVSASREMSFSGQSGDKVKTLFVKPIFKPVEVRLVHFENINDQGIALKRTMDVQPMVIWLFENWAIFEE